MDIVGVAIRNARLTISLMLFLTLAGALAYRSIPKEAEPDVQIPIIYVSMSYSRDLAGGFRTAAAASDGDAAQDDRQRQGDDGQGLSGWRQRRR